MSTSYIPSRDADLDSWSLNFATLITATPLAYGLTAPDAVIIQASVDSWHAAYGVTVDPSTRTPSAIAAKDAARATMLATVRPYAMAINARSATTDEQRSDLGITIRKTVMTPIPAPTTAPALSVSSAIPFATTLLYRDPATPTSKAKPFGVIGVQLWTAIGTVAAIDPSQATFYGVATKSPCVIGFTAPQQGKQCTVFARFVTRGGPGGVAQTGPWSAPLTFSVI